MNRRLRRFGEEIEVAARRLRQAHERIDERTAARATLELRELREERRVRRIVRERAGISRLCSVRIAAAIAVPDRDHVFEIARERVRQTRPVVHERGEREGDRVPTRAHERGVFDRFDERALERLPCAGRFHERVRGCVPASGLAGDANDRARRVELARSLVVDVNVGVERRARLFELVLEHLAHAKAEVPAPRRAGRLRLLDALTERVGERAPRARLVREAEDLRDGVVLRRIEQERAANEDERGVGVIGAIFGDLRRFHQDRDLPDDDFVADVGRGGETMLGQVEDETPVVGGVVRGEEDAHDLGTVLDLLDQRTEARASAYASRVVRERELVAHDRLFDLGELLALDVAEPAERLGLVGRVRRALGSAGEVLGELVPALRRAEEVRERLRRVVVVAERRVDRAPRLDRLVGRVELVAEDACNTHAIDAPLNEVALFFLRALVQDVDERAPALRLVEEENETIERFRIAGLRLEAAFPRPDRAVVLVELHREARGLAEDVPFHVRLLLEDREALEDVEAIGLALGAREERLDVTARLEERRVRDRRDGEDAEEQLDRALDVADVRGGDFARAHQELDLQRIVVRASSGCGDLELHFGVAVVRSDPIAATLRSSLPDARDCPARGRTKLA